MDKFSGKRVLVTGGGAGIGRGIAIKLTEMGAQVFALDKVAGNLDSLKAECPSITPVCVDLIDWDSTKEAVMKLTPLHLLVNNAAVFATIPFLDAMPKDFDVLFGVNVKAAMNVSQVVARDLIERGEKGAIVNVSSITGERGIDGMVLYGSTKGALTTMTKVMSKELAPKGIRVNAVAPSLVKTEMGKSVWGDPSNAKTMLSAMPQGKFAEVEDVVNAVVYLLSDDSDMVNGHLLPVDGGFLGTTNLKP